MDTKNYDIVVIGGGSGGLVAAAGAAKFGAKIALLEKNKLGGECLWTGCIPSKAFIHVAKIAHTVRHASNIGIKPEKISIDFSKIIDYVHNVITKIQPHDSKERFESLGVAVFFGNPRFENKNTINIGNHHIKAKHFIIATGSRPYIPEIPGLHETGFLTNETVFENRKFPQNLLVIGGGAIGSEMAQAFARLGSQVTILEHGDTILSKEDPAVANEIKHIFTQEGITILTNSTIHSISKQGKKKTITYKKEGRLSKVSGDEILLASGRSPNVEGLNLEHIGVVFDKRKIKVNQHLQTTIPTIYAIGDVKGGYQFTHIASYEAGIALANILFKLPIKTDYSIVPWTTFTDPEVAQVGLTEQEARKKHGDLLIFQEPFSEIDRAQTDNNTKGFIRLITTKKGKILGVHIIGPHAGELIAEYTLAMRKKLTIKDIYQTIHVYPTLSGINTRIAGKYMETLLTPFRKKLLKYIFRYG
ncbi:MAG: dihydrolipoyl dehydrogenase [Nanoarchaeota archaeon]